MNDTTWKPISLNEATRFAASAYWPFQAPYETPRAAGFAGAAVFAVSFASERAPAGRATTSAPSNAAAASHPPDSRRPSSTRLALADEGDVVDPEVVVGARGLRL